METIRGRCHCGNLSFELDWPTRGETIPVRACGCSFCTRHVGTYTSSRQARLRGQVQDASLLSRYDFGTKTAHFFVCARCGGVPFCTSEIEGHLYAVVNVNHLVDVEQERFEVARTDFDGEELDDRLARRARTWIPEVEISIGSDL